MKPGERRLSVDLPENLIKHLKTVSVLKSTTVKEIIISLLEKELDQHMIRYWEGHNG